jgi:hypothetical protein
MALIRVIVIYLTNSGIRVIDDILVLVHYVDYSALGVVIRIIIGIVRVVKTVVGPVSSTFDISVAKI